MKTVVLAVVSIILSVAAQFSLKLGVSKNLGKTALTQPTAFRSIFEQLANTYVLTGLLLYGLSAVVWLGVLSKWNVSKAYPLVGLGFVLTAGVDFLSGEVITLNRIAGISLICAGVYMVARS